MKRVIRSQKLKTALCVIAPFPRCVNPAGGLISNISDMMKWVQFQFDGKDKDGKELLSSKLLEMAHSPLVKGELDEHTGVAWFVEDIDGSWVVSHGGRVPGFTSKVLFVPDKKFGIVVLTEHLHDVVAQRVGPGGKSLLRGNGPHTRGDVGRPEECRLHERLRGEEDPP